MSRICLVEDLPAVMVISRRLDRPAPDLVLVAADADPADVNQIACVLLPEAVRDRLAIVLAEAVA